VGVGERRAIISRDLTLYGNNVNLAIEEMTGQQSAGLIT
jgi:hypothetical protein